VKRKKINKKLSFNKETVTDLNPKKMENVKGGLTGYTICSPGTCRIPCYTQWDSCNGSCDTCNGPTCDGGNTCITCGGATCYETACAGYTCVVTCHYPC